MPIVSSGEGNSEEEKNWSGKIFEAAIQQEKPVAIININHDTNNSNSNHQISSIPLNIQTLSRKIH